MQIRKRHFLEIALPVTMLAFIGQGSPVITRLISVNTRWIFLLVLFVYVFSRRRLLSGLYTDLRVTLFLYFGWCFLSIFWSEQPVLSCAKLGGVFLVLFACIEAGFEWVLMKGWQNSLTCFLLLCVFTLSLGLLGGQSANAVSSINTHVVYQGLTRNSNYFGFLQALIYPYLLWQCYRNWAYPVRRLLCCFLLVLTVGFLLSSFSRSAIAMVLCTSIFFVLGLTVKKRMLILMGLCLIIFSILSFLSLNMTALAYKGDKGDLFKTRREVWDDSLNAAQQGGWLGGGYGVSIGDDFVWKDLSGSYGREKGNSQLAVIEETGLIGGGIYLLFWLTLLSRLFSFYFKLQGEKKTMFGLVLGGILGLLMQSLVEAWWTASAAPESIFFWVLYGISVGYMRIIEDAPGPGDSSVGMKE
jgi:hypothetical protein